MAADSIRRVRAGRTHSRQLLYICVTKSARRFARPDFLLRDTTSLPGLDRRAQCAGAGAEITVDLSAAH
jgi:hypothetical protein